MEFAWTPDHSEACLVIRCPYSPCFVGAMCIKLYVLVVVGGADVMIVLSCVDV